MIFELSHSICNNEFYWKCINNFSFHIHLHRSFEFFAQIDGLTEIIIDEKEYRLSPGQAVLIFPFQTHSYQVIQKGKCVMCIFSPDLVPDFSKDTVHRLPADNLFLFPVDANIQTDNIFLCRSLAYGICGTFEKNRRYTEKPKSISDDVFISLLLYADKNFCDRCLLRDAAVSMGYDYAYLSKRFKAKAGIPFNQYVNVLRIHQSKYLLTSTEKSITEIAYACGFQICRTFNREFFKIVGCTPSEYRKTNP